MQNVSKKECEKPSLSGDDFASNASRSEGGEDNWTHCRILVAEDNPVNQLVAKASISQLGCQVNVVSSGREAIDAMAEGSYDIVFMDCQMPEMDGYEATKIIREREKGTNRPRTPIIALTAHAMEGDRDACLASGMDDYLAKPFLQEQVRALLKRWIGDKETKATQSQGGEKNGIPQCTAGTSSSDQAPIDKSILDKIRRMQREGAPDLVGKVVTLYLSDTPKILQTLGEAVQGRDTLVIYQAAHQLKSSSANVGALHLAALLNEAETLGRENQVEGIFEVLTKIRREYEAAKIALEAELSGILLPRPLAPEMPFVMDEPVFGSGVYKTKQKR